MRLVLALILASYLAVGPAMAAEDDSERQSDIVVLAVQKRNADVRPIIVSVPAPTASKTTVQKDVALAIDQRNARNGG